MRYAVNGSARHETREFSALTTTTSTLDGFATPKGSPLKAANRASGRPRALARLRPGCPDKAGDGRRFASGRRASPARHRRRLPRPGRLPPGPRPHDLVRHARCGAG